MPVESEPHHHDGRDADDRQGGDEVAEGHKSTGQEGHTVGSHRDRETRKAADHPAGNHGANEGLNEIGGKNRRGTHEFRCDRGGRWQQNHRHAEPDGQDFPEKQQEGAEADWHDKIDQALHGPIEWPEPGEAGDRLPCREPEKKYEDPEELTQRAGMGVNIDEGEIAQQCDCGRHGRENWKRAGHCCPPMCRRVKRSAMPTVATISAARAAAAKSAAHIWIV